MSSGRPADTSEAAYAVYLDCIRAMPPAERLVRALELSALVRSLVSDSARRATLGEGEAGYLQRFLRQLYGPDEGDRLLAIVRATPNR